MKYLISLLALLTLVSCAEEETAVDIQETAQQIGDVMASVDESGGTTNGTMAIRSHHKDRDTGFTWGSTIVNNTGELSMIQRRQKG